MRFKSWVEATEPFVDKKVDPALLTFEEFWNLINPSKRHHSSGAYDWNLSQMKDGKDKYPQLLFRRVIGGISFEFRMNKKDRYNEKFVKQDGNGNVVRINGEIQYYTPEELERLKMRRWEYSFAVFDNQQQVAASQDEWGCLLVVVAREYRGFGLGPVLTKIAWEAEPGKDSGGCTSMGASMVKRVHAQFVNDYLQKGFYSYLVRQGSMTQERVKAILTSAKLDKKQPTQRNLSDDPNDWLLYADGGSFIVYNKNLKTLIEQGDDDDGWYWLYRYIKATAYVGGGYHDKQYILHQLGGDTPQLRNFMMLLAVTWTSEEGDKLKVYEEDMDAVDKSKMNVEGDLVTLTGKPADYKGLAYAEKRWRKQFDKYDEFKVRLLELAEAKFRDK